MVVMSIQAGPSFCLEASTDLKLDLSIPTSTISHILLKTYHHEVHRRFLLRLRGVFMLLHCHFEIKPDWDLFLA